MHARSMIGWLVLTLAGLVAGPTPPATAQVQSAQRIAAVVNDDIVSTQDLRERLMLVILFSGLQPDIETQRRLAPQVLRRVIDERLQLQEARRRGVGVLPQEIQGAVQNAAAANRMTPDQLLGMLAERGIDPDALRGQIEAELAWLKLVRQQFATRVVVTDQQVDLALDTASQSGRTELLLSEILLPIYDPEQTAEVMANAEELRAAIRQGGDFGAIAQQVSAAGSSADGGDLGWVPLDAVQQALQPLLAGLGAGQLSDPVVTPVGVQFFLVRDRRTASGQVPTDALQLAQLLFPVAANASEAAVAEALGQARNAALEITGCGDIERLARQLGLPNSGDLGWLRPADLPPEMARVLAGLPLETLSQPVRSFSGVHLLMTCADSRSGGDVAQRALLRRGLEEQQIQRLAARYLRDLRKDAFIDVRVGN